MKNFFFVDEGNFISLVIVLSIISHPSFSLQFNSILQQLHRVPIVIVPTTRYIILNAKSLIRNEPFIETNFANMYLLLSPVNQVESILFSPTVPVPVIRITKPTREN